MKSDYLVRVYIWNGHEHIGNILNAMIENGQVEHLNTVLGMGNLRCFYDIRCDLGYLYDIAINGGYFMPLNRYEDFIIEKPDGERIDDDMIIKDYSEPVLHGYNIKFGDNFATAKVRMI